MSSKRGRGARAGAGSAGAPALAHHAATGQAPQRAARAAQTVAPSSIIAWFQAAARPAGSSSSARRASARGDNRRPSQRSITRRALTSTAARGASHANAATAAAV